MKRIGFVTSAELRDLTPDDRSVVPVLAARGVEVAPVVWTEPLPGRLDGLVLRSTWDYAERLPTFLAWIARVSALTRLLNPPEVVRWNADKHYLAELARAAVPVVASEFVEPQQNAAAALGQFLARQGSAEIVVKPAVGAGSRDALRGNDRVAQLYLGME